MAAIGALLLWGIVSPRSLWQTTQGWRYRNQEAVEPSDTAYALCRWGSVIGIVILVIITVTIVRR